MLFKATSTLILLCITLSTFASELCDEIYAEEHTRIYYANGMNNQIEDWEDARNRIDGLLGNSPQLDPGYSINNDENAFKELLEAFKQKSNEPSKFWQWLSGLVSSPEWFKLRYAKVQARIANEELINDADLLKIVEEYLDDLRTGIKVVIVAHSQGNLYANSAIRYIRLHYPQYSNSIGLISVGTPANRVEGGGPHTTNKLDLVIEGVRLASNFGLVSAPLLATGSTFSLRDISGHQFVNTYIRQWGNRIQSHIFQTIARLKTPPKEFECKKPEEVPIIVQTASVQDVGSSFATLTGNIIEGKMADAWFLWRAGTTVGSCFASGNAVDGKGFFDRGEGMTQNIFGLKSNTRYSFRACGKNVNGMISSGTVKSFTTDAVIAPTRVSTLPATYITNTTVTLNGHVDSGTNIDTWFVALKNSFPSCSLLSGSYNGFGSGTTGLSYYQKLTGLDNNSTYNFRFCGKGNTGFVSNGYIRSFRTTNIKSCGRSFRGSSGHHKYRIQMNGTGSVLYKIDMVAYNSAAGARFIFRSNGNAFIDTGLGVFRRNSYFNFTGINGPYIDIEIITSGTIDWYLYVSCP